jgi:hypothetical protein
MDFPPLVSDPDTVPATAKIRSAQGQVTRQFVGNRLGAFGVSKRHATEVRQDPAIDQDIKIEPRHAGSHRETLAAPNGVRATPCCGETAQGALLPEIPRERIARSAEKIQDHDQAPPQPATPFSPLPAPMRMSPIER